MADITLKLIWYRLSQTYSKMAAVASTWYTDLDFDSYVLDLLLVAWCVGAAIVYLTVNSIKSALGPVTKQPAVERFRDYALSGDGALASVPTRGQQPETCHWFNTVVGWLYIHYYHSPVYLQEWVKALNDQLNKLGGPVQSRVESVQHGSLPPKILTITCQVTQDGGMVMLAKVESQDLLLSVFASQECGEGVRMTNCVAHVLKMNGTLLIKTFCDKKDVKLRTRFDSRPEVKVEVMPTNPYQDPSTLADMGVVEENVRNALALATTTITITKLLMPGDLATLPPHHQAGGDPAAAGGVVGGLHLRGVGVAGAGTGAAKPGEIRVRASDAGWGMSTNDIALLNQRFTAQNLQNQMAQLASSIQQPVSASQAPPVVQQVPPQSRPQPLSSTSYHQGAGREFPAAAQGSQVPQAAAQALTTQQQHAQAQAQQHVVVQKSPEVLQSISVQPVRQQQQMASQAQSRSLGGPKLNESSLFEPISPTQYQSAFSSPSVGVPLKPPRMVGDKRLYVKVIKGNALTLPGRGSVSAVCYISTDEPVQSYTSSVVRNTGNPFWDEHFLFDVTQDTKEVRFEVYDKSSPDGGEEYVGESTIFMEDLKRMPSSRQILRLQSQPGSFDYITGTITAEFLFMEPAEADSLLLSLSPNASQLSPRRRIEVSQVVTPGGTRVTTTTTTTQRPQFPGRPEAGYNTSPNYIEKHVPSEMDSSYNSERLSPHPGDSSAELVVINGVESVADTAIRELMDRSRRPRTPTKTSTLIITGVKRVRSPRASRLQPPPPPPRPPPPHPPPPPPPRQSLV